MYLSYMFIRLRPSHTLAMKVVTLLRVVFLVEKAQRYLEFLTKNVSALVVLRRKNGASRFVISCHFCEPGDRGIP